MRLGLGLGLGFDYIVSMSLPDLLPILRGDIRVSQFWDDFQDRADGFITSPSASGQPYIFLDFPTHSKPKILSKELVPDPAASTAYYLEAVPGSTIVNFGCTGRFATGPGSHDGGFFAEGVIIITDTPNAYLPNNFLHLRWLANQIIIEVTNSGVGGLRQVAVVGIVAPINEVISVAFTLEANCLTISVGGIYFKCYDPAFNESTWNTIIYEYIGQTDHDNNIWYFQSIWANSPVMAMIGTVAQPWSSKLEQVALGHGAFLNQSQTFTGDQSITGSVIVALGYRFSSGRGSGTAGISGGGYLVRQDDLGNTGSRNIQFNNDVENWGDCAIMVAAAHDADATIPRIYHDILNNRTTIGHDAATAPSGTARLNVEGTLAITGITTFGSQANLKSYTVAGLPAGTIGDTAFVTDATLTLITGLGLAPIGGGTNKVPVYYDGAWKIG